MSESPGGTHRDRMVRMRGLRRGYEQDRRARGPLSRPVAPGAPLAFTRPLREYGRGSTAGSSRLATILSIHSFRGGTGKSNTTANVAAVLAQTGKRVGVIDADIQSPGIHVLFGLAGSDVGASLNDFLFGEREIRRV